MNKFHLNLIGNICSIDTYAMAQRNRRRCHGGTKRKRVKTQSGFFLDQTGKQFDEQTLLFSPIQSEVHP